MNALGSRFTVSLLREAGGVAAAVADAGVSPGLDSTTDGAGRSGAVVTPDDDIAGSAPGAVKRSTWPTRIRFTFSMLFHAASSR